MYMEEIKNAVIESTMLGYEDHGIFTCFLTLNYGVSGQGFGGYGLDKPLEDDDGNFICRTGSAYGMNFIINILKIVGVEKWEELVGKNIRVKATHNKIISIGHFLDDTRFDPSELKED